MINAEEIKEKVSEAIKYSGHTQTEIAKAIGKDAQYVRIGLQQGILKFGHAMKIENSSEFNYYCPDKKVWEETGYFRDTSK